MVSFYLKNKLVILGFRYNGKGFLNIEKFLMQLLLK